MRQGEGSVQGRWVDRFVGARGRTGGLVGEVERYEGSYLPCYVRGPEGIIVELAEQIG